MVALKSCHHFIRCFKVPDSWGGLYLGFSKSEACSNPSCTKPVYCVKGLLVFSSERFLVKIQIDPECDRVCLGRKLSLHRKSKGAGCEDKKKCYGEKSDFWMRGHDERFSSCLIVCPAVGPDASSHSAGILQGS